MEINTDNSRVRCPSCGREWHILDTSYYCSCDYVFPAVDVKDEVNAIVYNAKLIANEMRREIETRQRIRALTENEISATAERVVKKKFGQKVWDIIKHTLPVIIEAVKSWIKIG